MAYGAQRRRAFVIESIEQLNFNQFAHTHSQPNHAAVA